jgi:hypothetical protein
MKDIIMFLLAILIVGTCFLPVIVSIITGIWWYLFLYFVIGIPVFGEIAIFNTLYKEWKD